MRSKASKSPACSGSKNSPTAQKPRKCKAALPAKPSGPEVVNVTVPDRSWTRDRLIAKIAVDGAMANATTIQTYAYGQMGEHGSMQQTLDSLHDKVRASKNGSSAVADELLIGQAVALNAISNELMRRAALNFGSYPDLVERYLRLGLKAQSQCRATLESLAKIKNPLNVTFVKQANVAQGHQQINNGTAVPVARTEETGNAPIELLEDKHGEWVVPGKTGEAVGGDQAVEAMGAIDRPEDKRGKGPL
jgi:hypothetical protein